MDIHSHIYRLINDTAQKCNGVYNYNYIDNYIQTLTIIIFKKYTPPVHAFEYLLKLIKFTKLNMSIPFDAFSALILMH